MHGVKAKFLALSALITTGLCVSFNLAYGILWTGDLGKNPEPRLNQPSVELESDLEAHKKRESGNIRQSYAS